MKNWKRYRFSVNGFEIEAVYNESTIQSLFMPLLTRITEIQKRENRRILVYLVAPPAVGKTTLSQFITYLSEKDESLKHIQALGLDGFHFHSEYINEHTVLRDGAEIPMQQVKGCPETFDLLKLKEKLQKIFTEDISWPIYDRISHDVIEDTIKVKEDIILLEGNWLLLSEPGWDELKNICDLSIMIKAEEGKLLKRLVDRKIKGGLTEAEAIRFCENSDLRNVKRVLESSSAADIILTVGEDDDYVMVG